MAVNIRLKEVLRSIDKDSHGVIQEIARALHVDRHKVSDLYNNRAKTVSLDLLGRIAEWLDVQGVPSNELLGELFGMQPSRLWEAIGASDTIVFYLGENRQTKVPAAAWRWISLRDAATSGRFIQQLSAHGQNGQKRPEFRYQYVPFRHEGDKYDTAQEPLKSDISRARGIYDAMCRKRHGQAKILVGSQRVNYLLEFWLADLFRCKPFVEPKKRPRMPFFFVYRQYDRHVPSCFGGPQNPFRRKDADVCGVHYLTRRDRWATEAWERGKTDAGLIIMVHDPRVKSIEMGVFGFTGITTEAMGDALVFNQDQFWPLSPSIKGRNIGVFVCSFDYKTESTPNSTEQVVKPVNCRIERMSETVLEMFLT
jgi:hypothetical protein